MINNIKFNTTTDINEHIGTLNNKSKNEQKAVTANVPDNDIPVSVDDRNGEIPLTAAFVLGMTEPEYAQNVRSNFGSDNDTSVAITTTSVDITG